MGHVSRVLAAVDFSGTAYRAFEYALALSTRVGAELVVVHIVPAQEPLGSQAHARRALAAELRRTAAAAGVEFDEVSEQGDPATIILSQARSRNADLIVLGTAGSPNRRRFRPRSVAERVAAHALVPVLVVPRRQQADSVRPFRNVAVAVKLTAGSRRTMARAAALASDRLTLLHVVPRLAAARPADVPGVGLAVYQDQLMRDDQAELVRSARRRLRRAARSLRAAPAAIDTRVLLGRTTDEIGRLVDTIGADLLVVGVPRRSLVWRKLFRPTAARLLGVVRIPVLAVPDVRRMPAGARAIAEPRVNAAAAFADPLGRAAVVARASTPPLRLDGFAQEVVAQR